MIMHLVVDLKICEGCGSLWYRTSGGTTVYCYGCAIKLGEFPSPRLRRSPGGRRKQVVTNASGLFQVPAGGAR
jgi:hypothetical protein